ncbi:MAG TPA: PRC-barrel domain-containing protein [Longimicrobiaceae bacterium]|nr:PRC-barrel domain-containing protein [Longimicrobiaceae bacterium]
MTNDDLDRVVPLDQLDDFKVADGDPDVRGWDVVASDGRKIGEVDQLLVDTAAMKVRYLDVDLDDDLVAGDASDRHVLIPIGYARLDENDDRVMVDQLASADVAGLPEYTHGPITRDFESTVRSRFDTGYTAAATTTATDTDRDFYGHDLYDDNRFYGARRNLEGGEGRLTLSQEELVVRNREVQETGTMEADLRRERVDVDREGDVRLRDERNDRL